MSLDSSGGYRWLDSYVMAGIIQLATLDFCERFLNLRNDPCGRQFDQMTQAARSGKMNIIEGSERAATSKETEMKLTDVAKASLGELRGDYETWLLRRRSLPWRRDTHEAQEIFSFRLDKPQYGDDVAYDSVAHLLQQSRRLSAWLEHEDSLVVARALIILIGRTINMLEHQVKWQHQRFVQEGGFREQLSSQRQEVRGQQQNAPSCPLCGDRMARRQTRSGASFWGCCAYPKCQGSRPAEEGRRPPEERRR